MDFDGRIRIHFTGLVPNEDTVKVAILDLDGATLVPDEAQYMKVQWEEGAKRDYNLIFGPKCRNIAERMKGQPFRLRISAEFGDHRDPTKVVFLPDSSLYVRGSSWLSPYIYGGFCLLLINLGLVVAAIYSRLGRRLALDPRIRAVVGIGVLKYVVTEPLLIHVPAIRRMLFRDYRYQILRHSRLAWWDDHRYISPQVSWDGLRSTPVIADSEPGSALQAQTGGNPTRRNEQSYQQAELSAEILNELLRSREYRQYVWLIEGESGLGKSALLQQVALTALKRGIRHFCCLSQWETHLKKN